MRVNVSGTRNVLDAARAHGCDQVVHISSVAALGYEHRDDLDEDAAPRPCGIPYIDTKAASEALAVARARAGEPIAVVRPGDVYGPGSTQWSVRVLEAIKRRQFMLFGEGEGLMTPVFVDDLVDAIVRALAVPAAAGHGFTAWDGHAVTAAEFFSYYARMLGRPGLPKLPRPLAMVARRRAGAGGARDRQATHVHPLRDHVPEPPRRLLQPPRTRGARVGAARVPRRGHAPHRGVVPARGNALTHPTDSSMRASTGAACTNASASSRDPITVPQCIGTATPGSILRAASAASEGVIT